MNNPTNLPIYTSSLRVLIVDDIAEVRQELRTVLLLVGNGANRSIEIVGEAANGAEAVQQALDLHPDVVLLDLEMPVLDGFAAAQQIKQRLPSCRVIALTIHDYEAARLKAIQSGVDAIVIKGTPVEILVQVITKKGSC